MELPEHDHRRYFVTYSGVKLPLKLITPLEVDEISNRNTWFCGYYDAAGKMLACEKRVYGEVEFRHSYEYHPSGALKSAFIMMAGEEPQRLDFPNKNIAGV